ncbi:MAG: outer membrane protein TolC [Chitinophagales bacterium]|jgi:outer membrane protein TolC
MKKSIIILSSILFGVFTQSLIAQELLSPQDVVKRALENNFGVQMSGNNLEIAANNKSILNTGFLPTVGASAGANYNLNNLVANFQNGTTTELNGAHSSSFNAGANLNYTLFDGLGRWYNYKQLKERYHLSELEAKATMENAVFDAMNAYYDVAVQTINVNTLKEAVQVSANRLEREENSFNFGQSNKLASLNAEVDLNTDSINLMNAELALGNSMKNLNALLLQDLMTAYRINTDITFMTAMSKEVLKKSMLENNSMLKQAEQNRHLNEYSVQINRARYLPSLSATAQYGWNRNNNNEASFLASSTSYGLSAGATLSWTLFDGGSTRTMVQNTKLSNANLGLQVEETKNNLNRDFELAWANYQNGLYQYNALEKNLVSSQYNFQRTNEQFKLGQVGSVDFRQAQQNLLTVANQVTQAKFSAKVAELRLLQLSGLLLETNF